MDYSAHTFRQVKLPTSLSSVRGITCDTSSATEINWVGNDQDSSCAWRSGWSKAHEMWSHQPSLKYIGYTEFCGVAGSDVVRMTQRSPGVGDGSATR